MSPRFPGDSYKEDDKRGYQCVIALSAYEEKKGEKRKEECYAIESKESKRKRGRRGERGLKSK